jgi:hypothetical protein
MNERSAKSERQHERWLNNRGPRLSAASLTFIGLIIGAVIGLYYAWIVAPVVFTEASPARLSDRYQEEYILLISQSYEADGDWERAEERLVALGDPEVAEKVAGQLEEFLRRGEPAPVLKSLAILAARMGIQNPAIAAFAPLPTSTPVSVSADSSAGTEPQIQETQEPSRTPRPTLTPTLAPSATLVPAFRLIDREQLCDAFTPINRIEVVAVDSFLEPLPGAEVLVTWEDGSDHFFTGFQPELGLGYGDFTMSPNVNYTVELAEGSQLVGDLSIVQCNDFGGGQTGGWRLTFQNTDVIQDDSR